MGNERKLREMNRIYPGSDMTLLTEYIQMVARGMPFNEVQEKLGNLHGIKWPHIDQASLQSVRPKMVYFISDHHEETVKIGISNNIRMRLRYLQMSSPVALKVVANVVGGGEVEAGIHETFRHLRLHGEWFRFGEEIRSWITENAEVSNMESQVTT